MKSKYGNIFFSNRHESTVYSAKTILGLLFEILPPVNTAIDFGCGVGTWLSVLKELGVAEIQGFDGPWVDLKLLEIPEDNFQQVNFEEKISVEKKYDLAISLETAEHVSENSADRFVEFLVNASDFILFSAAIPFQEGVGHVNEQWPEYWIEKFEAQEYVALDIVRKKIWHDSQIPWWYRQNIFLFVKQDKVSNINIPDINGAENEFPYSVIHPDMFLAKFGSDTSLKSSLKLILRSIKGFLRRKFGN